MITGNKPLDFRVRCVQIVHRTTKTPILHTQDRLPYSTRANFRRWILIIISLLTAVADSRAQDASAERIVVEADRLPNPESSAPFDVHVFNRQDLERAPALRLDDILRAEIPGFSLFRRNSSRTANPTTQGVTLRNFGPNGAGRTLVLLDGIPLNDPFAGYVLWSQIPTAAIESAVVVSGGGAGLFGNEALAGTIFLVSQPATPKTGSIDSSAGNYDTYDASIRGAVGFSPLTVSIFAERFSTSGYPVIRSDQRGLVDNTASADSAVVDGRVKLEMNSETSLGINVRYFEENRGNGTILTENDTTGVDASATWKMQMPAQSSELQLSMYGQHRKFQSTFSSINSDRTTERPTLDQFDVPADAIGASAVWSMNTGAGHALTMGTDVRWVEGETNEAFLWNGTTFTRLRKAGGDQSFIGVFVEDTWSVANWFTVVGGLRFDHWELFDGFRKEADRETGETILDSQFGDRSGDEINGRLGVRLEPVKNIVLRGAFYSGFRVPTLNELYRPFRVGNDVTDANEALDPESLIGGETGIEWQASQNIHLSATGFINRLEDAIGNITIGTEPGGGVLRQRQNLDLVVAPGVETNVRWQMLPWLGVRASYLFTHPTVRQAIDPALEGKLLAQTPENVVTGTIEWTPISRLSLTAQLRYNDRQFEDDQNSRVLRPFITVNIGAFYQFSSQISGAVKIENLFDEEIETGKSANGLVSIGAPRLVTAQLRVQF